jgi:molybdate/tungstate transport system substrate-binding protein
MAAMKRLLAGVVLLSVLSCSTPKQTVVIFHAGSLSLLMREVSGRFESNNPGVQVLSETSGSLDAIRKITELGKPCDLISVADDRLIQQWLGAQIADYYSFLGNEMVLATGSQDLFEEVSDGGSASQAWCDIVLHSNSFGISDPDRDPAGYYSHLVWKLAEFHYERSSLYRKFIERLDNRWVRPKSSELTALLQAGVLDFAFLYRSSAVQNELHYLTLPPQISLGEHAYQDTYSKAFVRVRGKKPDSTIEITGKPISYGIALVNPDNLQARRFLEFLLSPESQSLYRELGYTNVAIKRSTTGGEGH